MSTVTGTMLGMCHTHYSASIGLEPSYGVPWEHLSCDRGMSHLKVHCIPLAPPIVKAKLCESRSLPSFRYVVYFKVQGAGFGQMAISQE